MELFIVVVSLILACASAQQVYHVGGLTTFVTQGRFPIFGAAAASMLNWKGDCAGNADACTWVLDTYTRNPDLTTAHYTQVRLSPPAVCPLFSADFSRVCDESRRWIST